MTELGMCEKKSSADLILIQETFLKPTNQEQINYPITYKYGTIDWALQKVVLPCTTKDHYCMFDVPPLINLEASACRLAVIKHGTVISVAVRKQIVQK
ncbi:hypothetical protein EVAR_60013_1 [Eumeta japonica]|uniref:Uncharacterized protein n=1 Tax=Eumeta variegata TaxID=151549 RepID=A0A4C1ZJS6_EUMVA|nr:hypothetical protein EVAR_60013_1 [Eumeta japonica]